MRLYAMICGRVRCRQAIFLPEAEKDRYVDMPMPVFLITHPEGNVLFDTGPHPDVFKDAASRWGGLAKAFAPVGNESDGILTQLEKIDLAPDNIKYVVNSHLHFDHAGGNQFFPESTFLVSKKELAWAQTPDNEGKGYFKADWDHKLTYQTIEGEHDIFGDGTLKIIPMSGHSPGHQILRVKLEKQGVVILSGDSVPFRENYYEFVVPRNNIDNTQAIQSVHDLHRLIEEENAFLIHGHDPGQLDEIKTAPECYT